MNKTLVCFGIGMLLPGVRTSFCCIPTLRSPLPRRHRLTLRDSSPPLDTTPLPLLPRY
jgi:hypothetical protein